MNFQLRDSGFAPPAPVRPQTLRLTCDPFNLFSPFPLPHQYMLGVCSIYVNVKTARFFKAVSPRSPAPRPRIPTKLVEDGHGYGGVLAILSWPSSPARHRWKAKTAFTCIDPATAATIMLSTS